MGNAGNQTHNTIRVQDAHDESRHETQFLDQRTTSTRFL
jgi:hypothetical protein